MAAVKVSESLVAILSAEREKRQKEKKINFRLHVTKMCSSHVDVTSCVRCTA